MRMLLEDLGDSWAAARFDSTGVFPEQLIDAEKSGFRTTKVLAPGLSHDDTGIVLN